MTASGDPVMATRVIAICREAGWGNRVEAKLDNGLVLFVSEDEVYAHHRLFGAGAFAADPCGFIGSVLGFPSRTVF